MLDFAIVVPARLESQRFPRKLLQPVHGKPLILWTAENLKKIAPKVPLFFAVADPELQDVLTDAGFTCHPTDPGLPSGTDRIAVANREIKARTIINVQADEPVISADHLALLVELMNHGAEVATLATRFDGESGFRDPNKVKAIVGKERRALYFSRAPVPFARDTGGAIPSNALWHMGVYAYTAEALEEFTHWEPGLLEQTERLEQLRFLENGHSILVGVARERTVGIDVPEDLAELELRLLRA